jgi:excisionase family DNA binding protein
MRGFGRFQRAQMRNVDPRVGELFDHLRGAVDILEQVLLRPHDQPMAEPPKPKVADPPPGTPAPSSDAAKLAYTILDIQKLVGISRSAIYLAIAANELRAVKSGRRTLVLAQDLEVWLKSLPRLNSHEGCAVG